MRLKKFFPQRMSIIFSFLLAYIVILIVPIFIGFGIYTHSLGIIENEISRANAAILKQVQQSIDSRLSDVEQLAVRIGLDSRIAGLMSVKNDMEVNHRYTMYQVINDFRAYIVANQFIHSFYVYFRNSDTAITNIGKYDVVLLSDIGSNTMLLHPDTSRFCKRTVNTLKLIKEYVENGGGFGMIGGYMTFQGMEAKGKYKDTYVEEILPVNLLNYDDRTEVPEGADLKINPDSHVILNGLPEEWPYILGYNRLIDKSMLPSL